jgi:hypothetical protein
MEAPNTRLGRSQRSGTWACFRSLSLSFDLVETCFRLPDDSLQSLQLVQRKQHGNFSQVPLVNDAAVITEALPKNVKFQVSWCAVAGFKAS